MARSNAFAEHALDLLMQTGPPFDTGARLRAMFGGHGIFCDGVMFALIADDTLYLKVDPDTKPRFEAAGAFAFVYAKAGKDVEMSYMTVPDEAGEDLDELRIWAHLALAAAHRAKSPK